MEPADEGPTCRTCGAACDPSRACAVCGATTDTTAASDPAAAATAAVELRVLPSLRGDGETAAVKLIRQLKMPTVDRLVADPHSSQLPGAMEDVARALDEGDLEEADRLLDSALGTMLAGPGHDRRTAGWGFLPALLWIWCGALLVLLVLNYLL